MDEVQSIRVAKKLMFREHELKALQDMVDMYREEFGQDSRWLDAHAFVHRLASNSRAVGEDEPV